MIPGPAGELTGLRAASEICGDGGETLIRGDGRDGSDSVPEFPKY